MRRYILLDSKIFSCLNPYEIALYTILSKYKNAKGDCFPSRRTLSEKGGFSISTYTKYIKELIKKEGYNIDKQHIDCGIEIYDKKTQDTHSGGSGCACSAVTFCGKIFHQLKSKNLNRILFIPTGALMSPTSLQQGENIAGIAHGVIIEN